MLLPKVNTAQPKQHRQRRADLICRSVAAKQIADRSPGHSGGAAPERRENVVGNGIADALAKDEVRGSVAVGPNRNRRFQMSGLDLELLLK